MSETMTEIPMRGGNIVAVPAMPALPATERKGLTK